MTAPQRPFVVTPSYQLANDWARSNDVPRRLMRVVQDASHLHGLGKGSQVVVLMPPIAWRNRTRLPSSIERYLEAKEFALVLEATGVSVQWVKLP